MTSQSGRASIRADNTIAVDSPEPRANQRRIYKYAETALPHRRDRARRSVECHCETWKCNARARGENSLIIIAGRYCSAGRDRLSARRAIILNVREEAIWLPPNDSSPTFTCSYKYILVVTSVYTRRYFSYLFYLRNAGNETTRRKSLWPEIYGYAAVREKSAAPLFFVLFHMD